MANDEVLKYHTTHTPVDCHGKNLKPLDLVLIESMPEYYMANDDFSDPGHYIHCYGLVNYYNTGEYVYEPYYYEKQNHPGWVNHDGSIVNVATRRVDHKTERIFSTDFFIPTCHLAKIPFNSIIMNIFVEYPWQMMEEDGPSDYLFIRKGIPEYEYLKKILEIPYDKLVEAHNAAMEKLGEKLPYPIFDVS